MIQNEKLEYFLELTQSCVSLWSWQYDRDLHLLKTSCPRSAPGNNAFLQHSQRIRTLDQGNLLPAVLMSDSGLSWALTKKQDSKDDFFYIALGPVYLTEQKELPEMDREFYSALPVLGLKELEHCASMLHKTVNDETAPVYCRARQTDTGSESTAILLWSRLQEYIRSGDLRYREIISEVLTNRSSLLELGAVTMESARRTALLTVDLSCQAAQEGGLSAKSVEAIRSQFVPQLKATDSGFETARLCDSLIYQLIRLVRRAKGDRTISEPVLACRMYIEEHAGDRLTLSQLARQTGYSPDHLSKRFHEEFGEPLKKYILRTKIQRAQLMLTATSMPISDIAAALSFCSSSHFSKVFQRFNSQTPADYRALTASSRTG